MALITVDNVNRNRYSSFMKDQHVTVIDERDGKYVARCTCGWEAEPMTDRRRAVHAAAFHRANAKVQKL